MKCYKKAELENFQLGRMEQEEAAKCQEHIQRCHACKKSLQELEQDEKLLQELRTCQELFQRYSN